VWNANWRATIACFRPEQSRASTLYICSRSHILGGYQAPALAVGMARPRQLEGRMLAMLDTTRNRTTPALGRRVLAGILAGAVVAPLAAATVVPVAWTPSASPSPQRSSFTGRLGAVGAAVAPIASATPLDAGTWQIRLSEDGRSVYLTISTRPGSSHGTTIPLDRIEGLAAILTGPGGPSRYTLKRDAGTFDFEGIVRSGAGGGTFTFTPNAAFADELVRRGFSKPGALELGVLAWSDMGFAFLDELNAMKYERPTLEPLVNAAQHGVSLAYLRDLSSLGYRVGTLAALVRLRDHGVDAAFVRGMQAESLNSLSVDDLVRSRDHGIDPAYVRDLRALGYVLNLDQLVDARNHGIDPGYVREMGAAGFAKLSLDDLVNARNHGIDPRYVLDLQALGFKGLSLDQLVDARNHGIDPGYIREMGQLGYRLPLEALVRARDHGIDATTVQQMKSRGVDRPSIDRLIELHDRGANAGDALVGPHLQASGSLKASVQTVLHDASAAVSRWADRWLK
jgi:hypothetical protein